MAQQEALKAACDVMKVSTGLATGTLVFSVGLLPDSATYDSTTRFVLAITWGLLVVSICLGFLSQAAVPVLMADQNYNIEAPTFSWPGRIHHVLFVIALILLGISQAKLLYAEPSPKQLHAATVEEALSLARGALGPRDQISKLNVIELINGTSKNRSVGTAWHAQFELIRGVPSAPPRFIDVLVDARSGTVIRLQQPLTTEQPSSTTDNQTK